MADPHPDATYGIRATRADPPGFAGEGERRSVYATALSQFEELMASAAGASPQTRPLSLFYALSQAGRAITAARLEGDWQLVGHGLKANNLDASDPLKVSVGPKPRKDKIDSFAGVAGATESESLRGSVTIGELWASLPGLVDLLPEAERGDAKPLGVTPDDDRMHPLHDSGRVKATVAPFAASSPGDAEEMLFRYRHGRTAKLETVQGLRPLVNWTKHGEGVKVWWPNQGESFTGEWQTLEEVAPLDCYTGEYWLRPELSDNSSPSELITWWALLYALSMLARYEPAAWFRALAYDTSPLAAPLGELLRVGVEVVPEMVLGALYGKVEWDLDD